MFDIGFQELIIIFVVALLVFGPDKLPEVGRTLGKWIIEIRKGIQTAKNQMDSEFSELEKKTTGENSVQETKEVKPSEAESSAQEKKEKEQV